MALLAYDKLPAAIARYKVRPPRTVALILGLDRSRYYVFFSQPNLGQLMNKMAVEKVNIGMELQHHASQVKFRQNLLPSDVKATVQAGNLPQGAHNDRRDRAAKLNPYLNDEAKAREIVQEAGHAEMFMIAGWKQCVNDYKTSKSKFPRDVEIYLTHSPCRTNDANPSPEMIVDGVTYPVSCRGKLYTFFKSHRAINWKIYYSARFGTAEGLTETQLQQDFPGIAIEPFPTHLQYSFF
jgi:hypothetical protein